MTDRAADAARWRAALASNPNDRIAWHNLASAECDLGHAAEAEAAARGAIALGIPAPETRLVLARALQAQRRLDEAEKAFDEAISLRPAYADAHRDLAQLVWMRTARSDLALARLDRALRVAPRDAALHLIRSIVLEISGDRDAALAAVTTGLTVAPRYYDGQFRLDGREELGFFLHHAGEAFFGEAVEDLINLLARHGGAGSQLESLELGMADEDEIGARFVGVETDLLQAPPEALVVGNFVTHPEAEYYIIETTVNASGGRARDATFEA